MNPVELHPPFYESWLSAANQSAEKSGAEGRNPRLRSFVVFGFPAKLRVRSVAARGQWPRLAGFGLALLNLLARVAYELFLGLHVAQKDLGLSFFTDFL